MTALAGVLGFPVGHSRSPAMMNAAFGDLGLDWRYVRLPAPPDRFEEIVRALPGSGFRGANVTIPHKLAAHDLADELSPAAAAIGAVNTLAFADGRILGYNTDAGGMIDALGDSVRGGTALVMGAGGAGHAAVWALREVGADVAIWDRRSVRRTELASRLDVRRADRLEQTDILVNATSLGMRGEDLPSELGLTGLEPRLVMDIVYASEPTALEHWARGRGAAVIDGLEVLVRQGARSLELWTGRQASLDVMRAALG